MTTIQWLIIRILYVSEPEPDTETYAWNETAPEPRDNKSANISKHIRSYVFVAWFSDMSVALRICSLACLYDLKANRNNLASILKYIWFSKMIVQNGHSLQSKCEVRKWKHVIWYFSIPLLGYQFSMGHVTSPDQGLSSKRGKSLGTRLLLKSFPKDISEFMLQFINIWLLAIWKI